MNTYIAIVLVASIISSIVTYFFCEKKTRKLIEESKTFEIRIITTLKMIPQR